MLKTEIPRQARIRGVKGVGRVLIITHPEERKRKNQWVTMNVKSFPGYLILHMNYTDEIFDLLESLRHRGVWGLLPIRPPKPKEPSSKHNDDQKGPAWVKYENLLADHVFWKPTAVETKEMAILMLREKDKHARKKDKKLRVRPTCDLKEGDVVKVTGGKYQGLEGKVKKITESQIDFFVTMTISVMGRPADIGISHKELERI